MQSKKVLYLIALATSKFVGAAASFLEKSPHKEALEKAKPHPPFSKITARKQKEKAAIAACQSRFDSGNLYVLIFNRNITMEKIIDRMLNVFITNTKSFQLHCVKYAFQEYKIKERISNKILV